MTISTKTNSTALSYLPIITNKTVEMIAMKIFMFVEVAIQSHQNKETGGYLKVLRGERGHFVNKEGCMTSGVSRVARSHSFRPYRSFGAIVVLLYVVDLTCFSHTTKWRCRERRSTSKIRFFFRLKHTASETYAKLQQAYGEDALHVSVG